MSAFQLEICRQYIYIKRQKSTRMVVVRDISANAFVRLGFKSKTQALDSYRGIRSLQGESQDDYLRRTWHQVKHVIDQNEIDDLLRFETKQRSKIEKSERAAMLRAPERSGYSETSSRKSESLTSSASQYDDLLDKYRELSNIVIQLKNENAILIKAYTNCARRVLTN